MGEGRAIPKSKALTGTKRILHNEKGTYIKVLKEIPLDYRAQETGKDLCHGDLAILKEYPCADIKTARDLKII